MNFAYNRFQLIIELECAAMQGPFDVATALEGTAEELRSRGTWDPDGVSRGKICDMNGNHVGNWRADKLEEDEQEEEETEEEETEECDE